MRCTAAVTGLDQPAKTYWPYLCRLMSHVHQLTHDPAAQSMWDEATLGELTPLDCKHFFETFVCSVNDPPANMKPDKGCSSTIEFAKKVISFFMSNRLLGWNTLACAGNPTTSALVNNLIKKDKRFEVRGQGKASQAKKSMQKPECRHLLRLLEAANEFEQASKMT